MSLASLLNKITWPIRKVETAVDNKLSEEAKEKTAIITQTAVKTFAEALDHVAPALGDLLSGEKVTVVFTHTIDIQLKSKE